MFKVIVILLSISAGVMAGGTGFRPPCDVAKAAADSAYETFVDEITSRENICLSLIKQTKFFSEDRADTLATFRVAVTQLYDDCNAQAHGLFNDFASKVAAIINMSGEELATIINGEATIEQPVSCVLNAYQEGSSYLSSVIGSVFSEYEDSIANYKEEVFTVSPVFP